MKNTILIILLAGLMYVINAGSSQEQANKCVGVDVKGEVINLCK